MAAEWRCVEIEGSNDDRVGVLCVVVLERDIEVVRSEGFVEIVGVGMGMGGAICGRGSVRGPDGGWCGGNQTSILPRRLISIVVVMPAAQDTELVHLALAQQLELEEETANTTCWRAWYLLSFEVRIPRFGGFGFGFGHGLDARFQ